MTSGKKPEQKQDRPEEFDRFEELTRRLIKVPKPEIDKAVKEDKERRKKNG